MRRIAYSNAPVGEEPVETGPSNDLVEGVGSEKGARGFITGVEMVEEFDAVNPDELDAEKNLLDKTSVNRLFDALVVIGNELDNSGEYYLADFADVLIKKFAQVRDEDPTVLFNSLILKVKLSDVPNTNDIIKKLSKIYSRTIVLEYNKNKDLNLSKESAYKKALHRAGQYLSEL
jgi:hypothetical protein